jgi:hypothetical protein
VSARDVIVGDVIDLELTSVDVAQHEIGCTGCMDRRDARKPPIEPDRAEKEGIRNLIIGDVVEFQPPVLKLRKIMSVVPSPLKSPKPDALHSRPIVPMETEPVN